MNEYDLLNAIKQTALNAVDAKKPVRLEVGTVLTSNPLKIQLTQKLTLSSMQLIIPRHLTKYTVPMTYNLECEEIESHKHKIAGTTSVTIDNSLKSGDKVLLVRQDGGQKYVVFDKVVNT